MFKNTFSILVCLLISLPFQAQQLLFQPVAPVAKPGIGAHFEQFSLVQAELRTLYDQVTASPYFHIRFGDTDYSFGLAAQKLLSEDYTVTVAGPERTEILRDFTVRTYTGLREGGNGHISLTIDRDYLLAMFTIGDQLYFIEQMNDEGRSGSGSQLILYNAADAIRTANYTCAVDETYRKSIETEQSLETRTNECGVVELAIASDATMYDKYNSDITQVLNHNIGVMNNVAFNYRHEFTDNIEYLIVTQYVSTVQSNDPLLPNSNSLDPYVLLPNFTAWGEDGGFGATYDIAQFWTDRDFDGGTVGLAYVGVVCNPYRYHVLQDFTDNANFLRCMTAHEIGHNFGAGHDAEGAPYIMAPSVANVNVWSATSINVISDHINSRNCLAACTGAITADFVYTPAALCNSGTVLYKDKSVNSSNRNWHFPGGSPANSAAQQPEVTYAAAGNYNTTIVAENGLTYKTIVNAVTVTTEPTFNYGSCPSPTGTPQDLGPRNVILNDLRFPSGNATEDGAIYQNRACSGIASLKASTTYTMYLTIGSTGNFEGYEVYIDYNNNGVFEGTEKVGDSNSSGYIGQISFTFTTPASMPANTLVRMRVITDYYQNNITGPCYQPIRGQVEDYGAINKVIQILPLDLLSFSGIKKGGVNNLSWTTANESGINTFEIERSTDGKIFRPIGQVRAANKLAESRYEFRDDAATAEAYYYRLAILSSDELREYSKIIYLRGESAFNIDNLNTLVTGELEFDLSSREALQVNIYLVDLNGRIIVSDRLDLQAGTQELKYNMQDIPAGIYFLKISSGQGDEIVEKLVKY